MVMQPDAPRSQAPSPAESWHSQVLVWTGLLLPPIAWAIQFQIRYALASWACRPVVRVLIHLGAVLFLAVAVAGGLLSLHNFRRLSPPEHDRYDENRPSTPRFMAGLGMLLAALFGLIIIVQEIPALVFDPCQF